MFKLSDGAPRQRGHFPANCELFINKSWEFAISGVFPNGVQKKFDSVPEYPHKIDRGYSGSLSKRKSGTSSHIAARTALTGGALLRLTKPLSEASNNGSDSWNYLKPM